MPTITEFKVAHPTQVTISFTSDFLGPYDIICSDMNVEVKIGAQDLMEVRKVKILILRFSSFGDMTQCLSVPSALHQRYPEAEIHWATRKDFASLLDNHPHIHHKYFLDRKAGFLELCKLGLQLRRMNLTHVYDAHNNIRSHILSFLICAFNSVHFVRKSQKRWKRFLLFKFKINTYQMPFSGQRDLLEPLKAWGVSSSLPPAPQLFLNANAFTQLQKKIQLPTNSFVALAPSAAFELKRWPLGHWCKLIELCSEQKFVILGGPEDQFLFEIEKRFPNQVVCLAGQCSLLESAAIIAQSHFLISNDTGLLHVAEQLGKSAIALMGPAPFGYPSRTSTTIVEKNLSCKPCSKHGQGPCKNSNYHECLEGISPEEIFSIVKNRFKELTF